MGIDTHIYIFEDDDYEHFYPLTINRPVYLLLCGARPVWQKWQDAFQNCPMDFACREELSDQVREQTHIRCNHFDFSPSGRVIFINGRVLPNREIVRRLNQEEGNRLFITNGNLTAAIVDLSSEEARQLAKLSYWGYGHFKAILKELPKESINSEWLNYIWDLIAKNPGQILADSESISDVYDIPGLPLEPLRDQGCLVYGEKIRISAGARVEGQTVLDARKGPILIDSDAYIAPHSFIEGPCFIGSGTQILGARVREGCSFGPDCRVGGEVEESIFLGYTNKYHEGFIGHAYLGEWVNLGALTTNSDLKNNYGTIRVNSGAGAVDTGLIKVGSFIADHVKTGIGTLLNSGITIGLASNVFGGGLIKEKCIPPFSWGGTEGYMEYQLDKALGTAGMAMQRRGHNLSVQARKLYEHICKATEPERKRFLSGG